MALMPFPTFKIALHKIIFFEDADLSALRNGHFNETIFFFVFKNKGELWQLDCPQTEAR